VILSPYNRDSLLFIEAQTLRRTGPTDSALVVGKHRGHGPAAVSAPSPAAKAPWPCRASGC